MSHTPFLVMSENIGGLFGNMKVKMIMGRCLHRYTGIMPPKGYLNTIWGVIPEIYLDEMQKKMYKKG